MKAVTAGGESSGTNNAPTTTGTVSALTGGTPTAIGSIPAQGLSGSRLTRSVSSKKGRRSVPSWDEIVFGSKP